MGRVVRHVSHPCVDTLLQHVQVLGRLCNTSRTISRMHQSYPSIGKLPRLWFTATKQHTRTLWLAESPFPKFPHSGSTNRAPVLLRKIRVVLLAAATSILYQLKIVVVSCYHLLSIHPSHSPIHPPIHPSIPSIPSIHPSTEFLICPVEPEGWLRNCIACVEEISTRKPCASNNQSSARCTAPRHRMVCHGAGTCSAGLVNCCGPNSTRFRIALAIF